MNVEENWDYANYIKEGKCKFLSPIAFYVDFVPVNSNGEIYS